MKTTRIAIVVPDEKLPEVLQALGPLALFFQVIKPRTTQQPAVEAPSPVPAEPPTIEAGEVSRNKVTYSPVANVLRRIPRGNCVKVLTFVRSNPGCSAKQIQVSTGLGYKATQSAIFQLRELGAIQSTAVEPVIL